MAGDVAVGEAPIEQLRHQRALQTERNSIPVVENENVEIEGAHLESVDRPARDVADHGHVAAANEGERKRCTVVLVGLGEPQPMSEAGIEPGPHSIVHRGSSPIGSGDQ